LTAPVDVDQKRVQVQVIKVRGPPRNLSQQIRPPDDLIHRPGFTSEASWVEIHCEVVALSVLGRHAFGFFTLGANQLEDAVVEGCGVFFRELGDVLAGEVEFVVVQKLEVVREQLGGHGVIQLRAAVVCLLEPVGDREGDLCLISGGLGGIGAGGAGENEGEGDRGGRGGF
jgi:hypothetical protein